MPLTPNNQPQPTKRGGWGWVVPLLIAGPTIVRFVRDRAAGVLTDAQLLVIVAVVGALIVLAVVGRRTWRNNVGAPRTPTYPAQQSPTYTTQQSTPLPQAPRFEPIITGKVMLAGLVLGAFFLAGMLALVVLL